MMAKYSYAGNLLKWIEESINAIRAHKGTVDYPLIEPLLLSSLEKVSHELGSVPLLQFVIEINKLNDRLRKTNANPHDTSAVLDTAVQITGELPSLATKLKAESCWYAVKAIVIFAVCVLMIAIAVFTGARLDSR